MKCDICGGYMYFDQRTKPNAPACKCVEQPMDAMLLGLRLIIRLLRQIKDSSVESKRMNAGEN